MSCGTKGLVVGTMGLTSDGKIAQRAKYAIGAKGREVAQRAKKLAEMSTIPGQRRSAMLSRTSPGERTNTLCNNHRCGECLKETSDMAQRACSGTKGLEGNLNISTQTTHFLRHKGPRSCSGTFTQDQFMAFVARCPNRSPAGP